MTTKKSVFKIKTINGDTLTPVTIFKKLIGNKKFLLESSFQHETKGRYSYIVTNPYEEIIGYTNKTIVRNLQTHNETTFNVDALTYIKHNFTKINTPLPLPFSGGAIGFVGYDAYRQYADIGIELTDEINIPDIHFMVYEDIVVYEHTNEKVHIISLNINQVSDELLDSRINHLNKQLEQ